MVFQINSGQHLDSVTGVKALLSNAVIRALLGGKVKLEQVNRKTLRTEVHQRTQLLGVCRHGSAQFVRGGQESLSQTRNCSIHLSYASLLKFLVRQNVSYIRTALITCSLSMQMWLNQLYVVLSNMAFHHVQFSSFFIFIFSLSLSSFVFMIFQVK